MVALKLYGPGIIGNFWSNYSVFLLVIKVCSDFLLLLESVSVVCVFSQICWFHLDYLICWPMIVVVPYNPFYSYIVSINLPTFIHNFSNLNLFFSFFLVSLAKGLSVLIFLKTQILASLIFFLHFSILYFIYFHTSLYYFLLSAWFGFSLLFFSSFLR